MTEAEWRAETVTPERFWLLGYKTPFTASKKRKTRLFLVACLRCVRHLAGDASYQSAVLVAERYADGQVSNGELAAVHVIAQTMANDLINPDLDHSNEQVVWHTVMATTSPCPPTPGRDEDDWCRSVTLVSSCVAECMADDAVPGGKSDYTRPADFDEFAILGPRGLEHRAACDVQELQNASFFRDVFGPLLFRPVTFSPSWRTDTAVTLAHQMYDSRDFSAMPILADALQDAGCDSADILDHCRGPGPHVRGCWVVDLVLGKE